MTTASKGVSVGSKPVISPRVPSIKEDVKHLLVRIDEGNSKLDRVETELGLALRQNVALRQLLATRWASLGYSLGVPGGVVAFIIKDVDGNRIEVSMD
jgi:hypothetical protein